MLRRLSTDALRAPKLGSSEARKFSNSNNKIFVFAELLSCPAS